MDDNVRGFDLELAGVGDVGGNHGGFFSGCHVILVIEGFQLFLFYAAVLEKALHLGFGKYHRIRRILLGFDDLVQLLMNVHNCIVLAVLAKSFLHKQVKGISLSAS